MKRMINKIEKTRTRFLKNRKLNLSKKKLLVIFLFKGVLNYVS